MALPRRIASADRRAKGKSRACRTEALEDRRLLGAPLALSSDGLILAGPDPLAEQEPALFADAEPTASTSSAPPPTAAEPAPLAPEDDPLSPVGDPQPDDGTAVDGAAADGAGGLALASCGPTITVSVWVEGYGDEERPDA